MDMNPYEFNLSFRLRHPINDLVDLYQKIINVTGKIPGRIWKAGEERKTVTGSPLDGEYKDSYCFVKFFETSQKSDITDPIETIDRFLFSLTPLKNELVDHTQSGGVLELYLSIFVDENSSTGLSSSMMKKISDYGIEMSIDIYPSNKQK